MNPRKFFALTATTGLLALGVAACGDDEESTSDSGGGGEALSGEVAGAGASSQDAAQQAWIAGFQEANPEVTIAYDPVGSGGGREQFIDGATAYGGTDSAFADEELTGAQDRCDQSGGELIQVPVYISPIAIVYNLPEVEELQLSPETLAGIFAQEITTWNDEAIAADNPDAELPDTAITPVNRSDDSGTTNNFTDYLGQTAPDVWTFPADDAFPVEGGEAADGTSGVIEAVTQGEGAIGYADASQAGDLGVAAIQIGDSYVTPTPEGAAAIVDESEQVSDGEFIISYELNRTTTNPDSYPIVLVSYEFACTAYDDPNEAAVVQGFLDYIISTEGQDAAAENAGSAPISEELRGELQPAVDAISG